MIIHNDVNILCTFLHKPQDYRDVKLGKITVEEAVAQAPELKRYKLHKGIVLDQQHTANVVFIDKDNEDGPFENCDAAITKLRRVMLTTFVADCQAIMYFDPVNRMIANVHAGWRGLVQLIHLKTLAEMVQRGTKPEDLIVYIAPCIHRECYEVGAEVFAQFTSVLPEQILLSYTEMKEGGKYLIDMPGITKALLEMAHVKPENIHDVDICTKCESNIFHSYRADGKDAGRNLAMIMLK